GPLHFFENFAWRTASERDPRQRSIVDVRLGIVAVQQNGHFPLGGDGLHFRTLQTEGPRLWTLWTSRIDFDGPFFPGRAVEHGLAVGAEPRHADAAVAERKLVIHGRSQRHRLDGESSEEESRGHCYHSDARKRPRRSVWSLTGQRRCGRRRGRHGRFTRACGDASRLLVSP